jgi:hypothetical protein
VSVYDFTPQLIHKTTLAPAVETGGTVLLVEDDEMMRVMAEKTLMRLGFTVLTAKDGVEAVDTFNKLQHKIHVVLCDLNMPRMNGMAGKLSLREAGVTPTRGKTIRIERAFPLWETPAIGSIKIRTTCRWTISQHAKIVSPSIWRYGTWRRGGK